VLLTILCAIAIVRFVWAQVEVGVDWLAPERLSSPSSVLQKSTVTADPFGGVHVFWVQNESGDITADGVTNLIFYTQRVDQIWSTPFDLFAGPSWMNYDFPYATHDADGRVHLVWTGSDGLYYSSVFAGDAQNIREWQEPQKVVEGSLLGQSQLVVDSSGTLHLIYAFSKPGTNVMYMRSDDGAQTWTESQAISQLVPSDPQIPEMPRLDFDGRGHLHVVWAENYPPEWLGRQVLYSRSTDAGQTWSDPFALSSLSLDSAEWNGKINIAVDSNDRIHAFWVCAQVGRCYRYSVDGGTSWAVSQPVFPGLIGSSGWDSMVADPYGNVYWLGALREPQGVYFAALGELEESWPNAPNLLLDARVYGRLGQAHFANLSIGMGNQLHTVMIAGDKGPIWYLLGQTAYATKASARMPTVTPLLDPTVTATSALPTPEPTTGLGTIEPSTLSEATVSESQAIVLGIIPVLILLVIVIMVRMLARGH
jgi:hypothetical protein